MKKLLILSLFLAVLASTAFAAGLPRGVVTPIVLENEPGNPDDILNYITNTATGTTSPNYILRATEIRAIDQVAIETTGTDVGTTITNARVYATTAGVARAFINQQGFTANWTPGNTLKWEIWYVGNDPADGDGIAPYPDFQYATWNWTIVAGSTTTLPTAEVPPWGPTATYTVNMSTVPAGYITPTTLGPVTDPTTIYGTYTPTAVSPTGYWTPASLTIDANTVWVADGNNFRFDQEFVWTELDYNNYHLTLNVVDTYFNGAYDINGYAVQAGTPTPIDALMVPAADPNPIDVDYTIAAAPDGYYWMPSVTQNPEFEMLQTKASKGVADYGDDLTWTLMQVNNYYRVIVQVWNGTDYLGVYDFTGPLNGSTPYVSTPITTYADYFGTYTMESPAPAGWQWQFTEYYDLDDISDFAQDPNDPYMWTAYVTFNLIEDIQTPVELSSFTATLTGQFYVQLSWTTQTETQMVGYRVYRSTTADQSTIELIDNPLVPATNTSTTQNYTVVDKDVLIGQTYYYWLEAVDYNNSNFHGPVSVTVTGNVPPVLPEVTEMKNAYPNPFKANSSTNIEVSLKEGDTGTLSIYNVQGQLVKIVSLTEGTHMVNWNGRDTRGNACGSGIYFYKLSTQSMNQTKKMVIVK